MYLLNQFAKTKDTTNEPLKLTGLGIIGSIGGQKLARTPAVAKLLKIDGKSNQQKLKLEYKNNKDKVYRATSLNTANKEINKVKKAAIEEASEYKQLLKNNKGNKDIVNRAIKGIKRLQKESKQDSTDILKYAKRKNKLNQTLRISSVKSSKRAILFQNKKLTNRVGTGLSIAGSLALPAIYTAIKNRKTRSDKNKKRGKYK